MVKTDSTVEGPLTYSAQHQNDHLQELTEFLRIPSISTQPERSADVRRAAEWLVDGLRHSGMENVQIIETDLHPLVYGDWLHAGESAPTVLVYGHYDVQPPEPLDLWKSPPFEPELRDDDYIYARGASDDKGQLLIHVQAVESYLKSTGELPVNVKFIVEGEEEMGGASLRRFIAESGAMLEADVVLISDTSMISKDQPTIVYGMRGLTYVFVDITGPSHDLHSGKYGGAIDNPLNVMGHVIARLKDLDGHVLIPGFYDKVRDLSPDERARLDRLPLDEKTLLEETGAPAVWGEEAYSLAARMGARPTLDVNGLIGGYTGSGGKTVLPSTAHAKISMRLVPDQEPEQIARLFKRYVESLVPRTMTVKVTTSHGAPATIVDVDTPAIRAAVEAYAEVFGKDPIFMRGGGSIPVIGQFQEDLGLQSVLMGFGLPDDRIHSPNERFFLPNYYQGIETIIHFYDNLARQMKR